MNYEKYLLLNGKKIVMFLGAFILAVLIHNFFYAITGIEEAVFFLLAVVVIPLYLIISILYTIFHHVKRRKR
ncbi:hypothetical protein GF336_07600 [Candidatus Woesearchaeota archaeon]|nr:hypothetical protein [Candidatus Woesearchaeota archaeon]